MINQVILIGRIAKDYVVTEDTVLVTLAVTRPYKNEDGIYETDIIEVLLKGMLGKNLKEYCKQGDLISIKGMIQSHNIIVGEKVTFLSTRKDTETGKLEKN